MLIHEFASTGFYDNNRLVEIVFEAKNVNFILNQLLPNNWKFVQKTGARLHTDPDRKSIVIPADYFQSVGNVFSLLHEIGHAKNDEPKTDEEIDEEIELRDKFNHMGEESLTEKEKNSFKKIVIKSEIVAWDFAIHKLIELDKNGLSLEPQLTQSDLVKIALGKIKTYLIE